LLFVSGFANTDRRPADSGDSASRDITIFEAPSEQPVSNPSANASSVPQQVVRPSTSALRLPSVPSATREPLRLVPVIRNLHQQSKPESGDAPNAQESVNTAITAISSRVSSRVDINVGDGKSGSASQESFEDILRRVYFNNWQQPTDAASDDAVVKVSITVASDGTVVSWRITKSSGDAAVDRSVEQLLRNVTHIAPFPSGSKDSQRTYPLSFSLKAKHSLG